MHISAMVYCDAFVKEHLGNFINKPCRILDVGAFDVNGTLRPLFVGEGKQLWTYTGVDMAPGNGVDLVVQPHEPLPFEDGSFDVVLSTSCLEHDPMFWITFADISRLVSLDGFMYVNVPSNGVYHAHPGDCWRWKDDAWYGLQRWVQRVRPDINIKCIQHFVGERMNDIWRDNVTVWRRNPETWCTDCAYARFDNKV